MKKEGLKDEVKKTKKTVAKTTAKKAAKKAVPAKKVETKSTKTAHLASQTEQNSTSDIPVTTAPSAN